MEQLAAQTGWMGSYFVGVAAPPKRLKTLSRALIERGRFTNIWFERAFEDRRGLGLEQDVRSWFSKPFDPPQVAPDFIRSGRAAR